jgi:hypothetical protein
MKKELLHSPSSPLCLTQSTTEVRMKYFGFNYFQVAKTQGEKKSLLALQTNFANYLLSF